MPAPRVQVPEGSGGLVRTQCAFRSGARMTIHAPFTAILTAQIAALEMMYQHERRCDKARWILDEIHAKRDELAMIKTMGAK
jgi:hypothetical protein